jgi:diguanylate cyclase (GGDEF)-like protein
MPVYEFSLLIQSAGTVLLFLVFLLLYRKIRHRAFLDWIASWAFLLAGQSLLLAMPWLGRQHAFVFLLDVCLLAHIVFLLRGLRRFRNERAVASPIELLWIVPVVAIAWWTAIESDRVSGQSAPLSLIVAAAYVTAAVSFGAAPGSGAARVLLSTSFLLWGVEQAVVGAAYLRFRMPSSMPDTLQYSAFAAMLLEMMIAVGIIVLLFERGQARLAREMDQLHQSDQELKERGIRDPLTGLYNRHHFNDVIKRELANVRRYGISLSVLICDVDRFKEINDRRGHSAGDDVLKFVAAYLTSCVRESDFVFRWGGDEFLVLLPRTDEGSAAQKSEELARRVPAVPSNEQIPVSLSVGWATHRMDAEFATTLAQADARMYDMKVQGQRRRAEQERDLLLPPS